MPEPCPKKKVIIVKNDVKGIPGQRGPQGRMGLRGFQGPQGLRGFQGMKGRQGPQGPRGPQASRLFVNNTLFVDIMFGNDTTAQFENKSRPWRTLNAAVNSAPPGSVIFVQPGQYVISGNLWKANVDWFFSNRTEVIGNNVPIFDDSADPGVSNIKGFGIFTSTDAPILNLTGSTVTFEATSLSLISAVIAGAVALSQTASLTMTVGSINSSGQSGSAIQWFGSSRSSRIKAQLVQTSSISADGNAVSVVNTLGQSADLNIIVNELRSNSENVSTINVPAFSNNGGKLNIEANQTSGDQVLNTAINTNGQINIIANLIIGFDIGTSILFFIRGCTISLKTDNLRDARTGLALIAMNGGAATMNITTMNSDRTVANMDPGATLDIHVTRAIITGELAELSGSIFNFFYQELIAESALTVTTLLFGLNTTINLKGCSTILSSTNEVPVRFMSVMNSTIAVSIVDLQMSGAYIQALSTNASTANASISNVNVAGTVVNIPVFNFINGSNVRRMIVGSLLVVDARIDIFSIFNSTTVIHVDEAEITSNADQVRSFVLSSGSSPQKVKLGAISISGTTYRLLNALSPTVCSVHDLEMTLEDPSIAFNITNRIDLSIQRSNLNINVTGIQIDSEDSTLRQCIYIGKMIGDGAPLILCDGETNATIEFGCVESINANTLNSLIQNSEDSALVLCGKLLRLDATTEAPFGVVTQQSTRFMNFQVQRYELVGALPNINLFALLVSNGTLTCGGQLLISGAGGILCNSDALLESQWDNIRVENNALNTETSNDIYFRVGHAVSQSMAAIVITSQNTTQSIAVGGFIETPSDNPAISIDNTNGVPIFTLLSARLVAGGASTIVASPDTQTFRLEPSSGNVGVSGFTFVTDESANMVDIDPFYTE
jgi:hypothetical protein